MGCTVFVNIRSVAHKGAGGKAVCMTPDVCKTPAAPSPVPIPYPNIAQDSSTADGSKTVKFDGNPIMLKTSNFSTSSGDEAGNAGGGIASSKFKGKAKFVSYSFDVKVEGKNVCRHLDMTLMNGNGFNDNGNYTKKSSKAEKHGDSGRALSKTEKQISELEEQLKQATGRNKVKIKNKIQKIIKAAQKAKKGTVHTIKGQG